MKVTIHQPAFMPWYPFFQKIQSADKFVFLTYCQYEKNGFQNRFNIADKWHTMSTKKGRSPINEKIYTQPQIDWEKIKRSLPQYSTSLDRLGLHVSNSLCSTNIGIIQEIINLLEIKIKIGTDWPTDLKGTERLVDICEKHGATEYISGLSGAQYLELEKFEEAGIKVTFQDESSMIRKPILEILESTLG